MNTPVTPPVALNTAPAAPAPLPPAPEGMVNVFVDGIHLTVKKGSTVMKACEQAEKEIPHFCYHDRLSIAGNCRMCLVEIEGMPKPIASCHWPVAEGMRIKTDSQTTVTARKGTMEFLLINHPLDCPICDQGGECDLQDEAVAYGGDISQYHEFKRAVDDKEIGSKIKTVMTRCIHCTRCVRFATEIAGVEEFGATGRGENMQIGTYVEQALQSELAGNMIDLCPVGALTSKPYAFTARPWELVRTATVDVLEPCHASIYVDTRSGEVMRVVPRENAAINEEWIADTTRFSYDALKANRLVTPRITKGKIASETGWPMAFAAIKAAVAKGGKAGLLAGQGLGGEDILAAAMFGRDVLGTKDYSALPMGVAADLPRQLPELIALESVKAAVLVGFNPRMEAPLLNLRLRKAVRKNGAKVLNIGVPADLTYPSVQAGTNPADLSGKAVTDALKAAEGAAVILVGTGAFSRKDGAAVVVAAQALAKKTGAKLALAHTVTGTLSALDMGASGNDTAAIVKAFKAGKYGVFFIHGDVEGMSAADVLALKGTTFTVCLGTHLNDVARACDVALPVAAWSEKPATYTNIEGKRQQAIAVTRPPLNAKEDWKVYRALSDELGRTLPFDTLAQLRDLMDAEMAAPKPAMKAENTALLGAYENNVHAFYLKNAYLRESALMHKMQAETGTAMVKKVS